LQILGQLERIGQLARFYLCPATLLPSCAHRKIELAVPSVGDDVLTPTKLCLCSDPKRRIFGHGVGVLDIC
jgi:hypothetical protein